MTHFGLYKNSEEYLNDKDNLTEPWVAYDKTTVYYSNNEIAPDYPYLCFTAVEDSTIKLGSIDADSEQIKDYVNTADFHISIPELNNRIFKTWNGGIINLKSGLSVYIYGDNQTSWINSNYQHPCFVMTGKINASGNVMSLLSKECINTFPFELTFLNLFRNCTSLLTPPELPAEILVNGCYSCMFEGCSSLISTPSLLSENIAISCYSRMFTKCSSLTNIPDILPSKTLYSYCYDEMFYNCKSITKSPILPALTLTDGCYNFMFNGCTNLKLINAYFNSFSGLLGWLSALNSWVLDVSDSGIFYKNKTNTYYTKTGDSGIPTGWTVVDVTVS